MSIDSYLKNMLEVDSSKEKLKEKDTAISQKSAVLQNEVEDSNANPQTPTTIGSQNPIPEGQIQGEEPPPEPPTKEERIKENTDQRFAELYAPGSFQGAQIQQESDPGTWTPEYTQMGFLEKTEKSLIRGFGKHVIGGTGDIVQLFNPVFGMDISEGNALSRFLQEQGEIYEEQYKVFLPPEIREPGFDMKTFMNPDFWSGHIAEYIPQLIEFILISKGAGAAAKGAAKAGARGLSKKLGESAVKKLGKKVSQNTTARFGANAAAETIEIAQGGALKGLITTGGELTANAGMASEIIGGGLSMNLLAGMQNAGQLINEHKDSGLYTEQELRDMASNVMTNNMQYLPIDMLSWGITYGQGTGLLKQGLSKIGGKPFRNVAKFYDKAKQLKFAGKSFQNTITPTFNMLKRVGNSVGKPLFEGMEETFQETFEEWSTKKAFSEVTGTPLGYENSLSGYMDFYFSKENEGTRAIAGALGALGGAGANIASGMNKSADRAYKLWNRSENMKRRAASGDREAEMMQDWHIDDQMINNKVADDGISNEQWLDTLFSYGVIDEVQLEEKKKIAADIELDYDRTGALNIAGKTAFLQNKYKKQFFQNAILTETEKTKEVLATLQEVIGDNPTLLAKKQAEVNDSLEKLIGGFNNEIALATENIENILSGKEATPSYTQFIKDKQGKTVAVGLTEEQYDDYYNKSDEELYAEIDKQNQTAAKANRGLFSRLSQRGKEIFGSLGKSKVDENKDETTAEPVVKKESLFEGNNNITQDDNSEITDEVFKEFTDNNKIPAGVVSSIIDKISKGEALTEQESAIREANSEVIEKALKEKSSESAEEGKTKEPKKEPVDEVLSAEEKINLENASTSTGKTKEKIDAVLGEIKTALGNLNLDLLDPVKAKKAILDSLTGKVVPELFLRLAKQFSEGDLVNFLYKQAVALNPPKAKATETTEESKEEPSAQEVKKQAENNLKQQARDARKKQNAIEQLNAEAQNIKNMVLRAKIYNINFEENPATQDEINTYLNSAIGKITYGPTAIHKARHLNMHLAQVFPEQKIQAYAFNNLMESIGDNALGYALLSTVLIDEKVWHQDDIFMHEMAHIYYQAGSQTPLTKALLENIKRNKGLITGLMETYQDYVKYQIKSTGEEFYRNQLAGDFEAIEKTGLIEILPLSQQDKILEEAFVRTLEGPLSSKYNKYFDENKEEVRKFRVSNWWKDTKKRGLKAQKKLNPAELITVLNNGQKVPYGDLRAHFLDGFVKAIKDNPITTQGMASRIIKRDNEQLEAAHVISQQLNTQFENALKKEALDYVEDPKTALARELTKLDKQLEIENNRDTIEDDESKDEYEERVADDLNKTWDKDFESLDKRMGKIIRNFGRKYSKELYNVKRKEYNTELKRREEGGEITADTLLNIAFLNPFKEHLFKTEIMELAQQVSDPIHFIQLIQESKNEDVKAFYEYLKEVHPEIYLLILNSSHLLYHNTAVIPAIINLTTKQGFYSQQDAFSQTEERIRENMLSKFNDVAIEELVQEVLEKGNIEAANQIIYKASNSSINARAIVEDGYLIVNKKLLPLVEAIKELVANNGLLTDGGLNPSPLVDSIINSNRKFSSFSIVKNPNGDQVSSRIIGNHLTKMLSSVRQDLESEMKEKEFLNKYSDSPLIKGWWNNYQENKQLPILTMDLGNITETKNGNKGTSYNNSVADQQLLNETLSFLDAIRKGKNVYSASMDIFGDSKRRYNINMTISDSPINDNGNLTVSGRAQIKSLFELYNRLRTDKSSDEELKAVNYSEFEASIIEEMKAWPEYIAKNAEHLQKIDVFANGVINNNRSLSKEGRKNLENFMFNRIVNSFYSHQAINPGIPLSAIIKRNKGNIAPVIALDKNLRVELLMWADERLDGILANDSGQYILEEDALAIQKAGKGVIDFNHGYKLFSHAIEKDPKSPFYGTTYQMKGYTTILSAKSVGPRGTQQRLKPLYDMLKARKAKYMAAHPNYNPDFGNGAQTYMPVLTPVSSEKAHLFTHKQLQGLKKWGSIEALSSPEGQQEYNKLMDAFYYNNGEFTGLDGSNFGPQQVMDKIYARATFSVQAISSILVGAKGKDLENSLKIQKLINLQKAHELFKNVLSRLDNNNHQSFINFVLETTNKIDASPIDIINLEKGMLPYFPGNHEFITNQIRKQFINNGNRLKVPGTYGQTISDIGYELRNPSTEEVMFVNGNSGLNFYGKDSQGNTTPMEAILPANQEYDNVRAREYFYGNNEKTRNKVRSRLNYISKAFGLKTSEEIENFIDSHVMTDRKVNGAVVGYYIPGETTMMTRIPHNGPAFMSVAEVVGFNETDASSIMVPSEFKELIGSDDDGDALFVYKEGKDKKGRLDEENWGNWNEALSLMKEQWLSPRMFPFLTTALNFKEFTKEIIAEVEEDLDLQEEKFSVPFSAKDYRHNFNNSITAKQTIGIAFNIHRIINTLAAFNTSLLSRYQSGEKGKTSITINGSTKDTFTDSGTGENSRVHRSTVLTNIILDSTKNAHADKLGLNIHTIGPAMILVNLGFDLLTAVKVLKHPAAIDYVSRFIDVNNDFIDTGSRRQILTQIKQENKEIDMKSRSPFDVVVTKKGNENYYNSMQNRAEIVRLMDYLFHVNNDISILSNLLSGHNKIERNPHSLNKQIDDFAKLIENKQPQQTLFFGEDFSKSEEIKSYQHTAKEYAIKNQNLSVIFNDSVKQILEKITKQITGGDISDRQLKHFSEMLLPAIYSRFIGINNIPKTQLEEIFSLGPKGAVAMLEDHIDSLSQDVIFVNPEDYFVRETALSHSLLFSEGITTDGETIRIHGDLLNKSLQVETIDQMREEFGNLPEELQAKLVIYDLVENGWSGNNSIIALFSQPIQDQINMGALEFQSKQEKIDDPVLNEIFNNILALEMNQERNNFPKVFLNQKTASFDKKTLAQKIAAIPNMVQKIGGTNPFYFEARSMSLNGKSLNKDGKKIYKVNPLSEEMKKAILKQLNRSPKAHAINTETKGRSIYNDLVATELHNLIEEVQPQLNLYGPESLEVIAIPDPKVISELKIIKKKDELASRVISLKGPSTGMAYRTDFNNFTGKEELTRDQFHTAMQYKTPVPENLKEVRFLQYQREKERANLIIKKEYKDDIALYNRTIQNPSLTSDEELLRLYSLYADKNIYAYSIVLVPVLLELTARASAEQSELTDRVEDGNDIGVIRSYLQANNIQSNHPATQAIARHVETEFKGFMNERKKYVRKINEVTEVLYKEKMGYNPTKSKLYNRLQLAFKTLFKNRKTIYQNLYGNIVDTKQSYDTLENPVKALRLKNENEINRLYKEGNITKAEYDFATMFREITNELHKKGKDFDTGGFVPAVGMSRLEAYSNRGLLGVLTNSKSEEEGMEDVRLNYQENEVSYKTLKDIFRNDLGSNYKNVKDFIMLQRKAKKLLKKGINEDGSPIQTSRVQNLTLLGDGFVNKFANDGFVPDEDLLSMDLNKALNEFVHTTLFVNGNENFQGFTKLQAQVDGLLLHNKIKGYDNQAKYVRKVYKEYFLKGKRLQPQGTTDKVIDALVKGNMLYIMGYKLLVVSKAAYVIGNVVVGKYHNVKNDGGRAWSKGESRFWGLSLNGPFGTRKASKILDNLNYMDVNLYDTVNMQAAGGLDSLITDIALMPMQYSEKWIQGVHFLGLLTDEQWNKFDNEGNYKEGEIEITAAEIAEIENNVKGAHGKGYTPTDQRMIQQYSWGKAMMQFSRFIPTMFHDRFAKEDIDIYGKEHVGNLRSVWHLISRVLSGETPPKDIASYRANLSPEMRRRFDSGLRGIGITSLAMFVGSTFNVETANELTGDANYLINSDKLEFKIMPSVGRTIYNATSSLIP
jgi:hypothetical protein